MKPLILCAAVTGGGPAKSPAHPVTPEAVVASAVAAWRAGAAVLHLHARRPDGGTTMDPAVYADLVRAIRAEGCDALISLSAGDDGGRASHAQRLAVADAGGDLVSLALGSFNFSGRLYDNRPDYVTGMAERIRARGAIPEFEVFDTGHLHALDRLLAEGLAASPVWVDLVLGLRGCLPADPALLPHLVARLPPQAEWAVTIHGGDHERFLAVAMHAFVSGGHIRTGLEDHPYARPGEFAQSNAAMVAQWVETARLWGRPVATPEEARRMIGGRMAAPAAAPAVG